jgi:hypothetical protein
MYMMHMFDHAHYLTQTVHAVSNITVASTKHSTVHVLSSGWPSLPAPLAQSVDHWIYDPKVVGLILKGGQYKRLKRITSMPGII